MRKQRTAKEKQIRKFLKREGEPVDQMFSFRVSREEMTILEDRAKWAGITKGQAIRRMVLGFNEVIEKALAEQ